MSEYLSKCAKDEHIIGANRIANLDICAVQLHKDVIHLFVSLRLI